jgi:hypothetical protein
LRGAGLSPGGGDGVCGAVLLQAVRFSTIKPVVSKHPKKQTALGKVITLD